MKLKGIFGFIEIASIGLIVGVFLANFGKKVPEIISTTALVYYIVCLILLVLGVIGFIYSQIIRTRIKRNPELREKYVALEKPVSVSVKSTTSPLQFFIVLLVGTVVAFLALAFLVR